MKLEQQVCSLELAQKLKELGVKQESLFYWVAEDTTKDGRKYHATFIRPNLPSALRNRINLNASAFTVAELGEMLPITIEEENRKPYFFSVNHFVRVGWQAGYETTNGHTWAFHLGANDNLFQQDATEADARAKMLIYLLENKLITV